MTGNNSKFTIIRRGGGANCSIVTCPATKGANPGLCFAKVPKKGVDDEWRAKLLHCINRWDLRFNPDTAHICSRHFDPSCFTVGPSGRRRLIPGSIPTVNMPSKFIETPKPPEREPPIHIPGSCPTLLVSPNTMETHKPPPRSPSVPDWREGCRIVDLWELAQQMNCEQCSSLLDLNRTTWETRAGLASVLYIVCHCGVTNKVHTSKRQTIAKMTTTYFINIQASSSVQQHCKISAEQACKFLNGLDIPVTEEVFDTTDQESKTLHPVKAVTQLESVATCQETQSVFNEIENRPDFCKHPPQKAMDLLEPATTDVVLCHERAPAAWANMDTDDHMKHMNIEIQSDETGSAEKCQEVCQAELHSDTSDNKEKDVEDTFGTLCRTRSKDLLLMETAKETEVPLCTCNPLETEATEEYNVTIHLPPDSTEWNEIDKKRAEAEFGEPPSCDTPAAVTGTTPHGSHEGNESSILSSTSHSQQAKRPAASIFRFRVRKSNIESFIVNDVCAPFKCSECGARFGLQKGLNRHKSVHANERTIIPKFHNPEETQNKGQDKSCKKFNTCSQEKNELSQNVCDQFAEKVASCQEASNTSSEVSIMHRNEFQEMLISDNCVETEKDKLAEKQKDHCKEYSDGEDSFKCSNCHAAFDTSSALEDHFKFHTAHRLFSCQDCSASFSKDKELKHHVSRIHRNKRTFSCPVCSVTVTTATSLKKHMRIHRGEKPFKCEVCEKMFTEKSTLRTHMRIHSGNLPHVCSDCGKGFPWPSGLIRHRNLHTGHRPYSCQECRATFPAIYNLNLHMRVHTDKRYFSCEICKKSFRQSGHLHRHIEAHKAGKTFLCQDCGKTFSTKEYFDQHYRIHTGERPYKCPSCPATFSRSASRWFHMRTHTGERFVCEVCQRAFKSKQSLTLHQEIHSGKECLCQQCGKTFLGKLRLRAHLRIHSGFANRIIKGHYICRDCGKTFNYLSNLYRHKKGVHLRLKPYQCTVCQKSFSQSNALKAHFQIHCKLGS